MTFLYATADANFWLRFCQVRPPIYQSLDRTVEHINKTQPNEIVGAKSMEKNNFNNKISFLFSIKISDNFPFFSLDRMKTQTNKQ